VKAWLRLPQNRRVHHLVVLVDFFMPELPGPESNRHAVPYFLQTPSSAGLTPGRLASTRTIRKHIRQTPLHPIKEYSA
jgi:hypothetical protein